LFLSRLLVFKVYCILLKRSCLIKSDNFLQLYFRQFKNQWHTLVMIKKTGFPFKGMEEHKIRLLIISLYIITTRLGTLTGWGKIPGMRWGTGTFSCRVLLILVLKVGIIKFLNNLLITLYFWPQHSSLYFKSSIFSLVFVHIHVESNFLKTTQGGHTSYVI